MDVLQQPVRRPVHTEAEVAGKAVVPRCLEVAHRQIARDQRLFQIKPQQDVQIVLHLVGLGPDVAVGDAVHAGEEIVLGRDADVAEGVLHPAIQPAGEGAAAAQLILVDAALAFVDAHRHALPQRRQQIGAVDILLVAGMADLVDRGIEAVEGIIGVGPRRDPHVEAGARGERMHRLVDAAVVQVIAEGQRNVAGQRHLAGFGKAALQDRRSPLPPDGIAQRHQPGPHRAEHGRQLRRRGAGLVVVEHRIVRIGITGDGLRLLALEVEHLLQRRQKSGHVLLCPGLRPDAVGAAGLARDGCGQLRGHLRRAREAAADVTQLRLGHRILGDRAVQPAADARVDPAGVQDAGHGAVFLGALFGGAVGHHGFLVPAKAPRHLRKRLRLADEIHQVGVIGHARDSRMDCGKG